MLSQYAAEVEARYEQERIRREAERAHLLLAGTPEPPRPRRRRLAVRIRRLLALGPLPALRVPPSLWG